MDEIYVTYVDDEHVDNHDYDDNTDDDHDNNNDLCGRACNARVNTSIYIYIYCEIIFETLLIPGTINAVRCCLAFTELIPRNIFAGTVKVTARLQRSLRSHEW